MTAAQIEPCPGCGALFPPQTGAMHQYIGASTACWGLYSALLNGGEPPLAPGQFNALLVDAYAAQHPGQPSPQAIQSVAVHLLTLYGVLVRGLPPQRALWVRQQAVSTKHGGKDGRYSWLTPPDLTQTIAIAAIVAQPTPAARTALVEQYVRVVWQVWAGYEGVVGAWYGRYVAR
ncbi:MAG: hypothetical protein IAE79_11575 [Anaerolinea sp.]|nr:hypothetical protein [Anaerolinea sp.]